jgi:hypothetical protein
VAAGRHGLTTRLAQPSCHPALAAWARRGARAPPVVTTRWRHTWRWASVADGVQPGDEVWGTRWGWLTQEEGNEPGKKRNSVTHRGGRASVRWWVEVYTVAF